MLHFNAERGAAENAAIDRLYSSAVLRELSRHGKSPTFVRLALESGLADVKDGMRLGEFLEFAFAVLSRQHYRTEHIYKTALLQHVLLGRHSLRTATMLSEFRVGDCRADVVILNGTSTAYEVKSERDGLGRLARQVAAYRAAFARVNVLAGSEHVRAVLRTIPQDVGVLELSSRGSISTIRPAVEAPFRIQPAVVFDALRRSELEMILALYGIELPNVPNTLAWEALRAPFVRLRPEQVHDGMVRVLRRTRSLLNLSEFLQAMPVSLRAAVLPVQMRRSDRDRLLRTMDVPMTTALAWA